MNSPYITVIMSSYNHEKYVGKAIESVLNQTYKNFEFLIVDDGSTDNSDKIIATYTDSRIIFKKEKKNTSFSSRIALYEKAKGTYIATIDSDDIWSKELLSTYVSFMDNHLEYGSCFCLPQIIDSIEHEIKETPLNQIFTCENKTQEEWFRMFITLGNRVCTPSMFIRSYLIKKLGIFKPQYRQLGDYELWLRLLMETNIYVFPNKLMKYRIHYNESAHNMSMPTEDVLIRLIYENTYIIFKIISQMDPILFTKMFYPYLIYAPSDSHFCIECEKFFVLLNKAQNSKPSAILYYFEKYDDEIFKSHLEKYYGFTRQDFWNLTGQNYFQNTSLKPLIDLLMKSKNYLNKLNYILQKQESEMLALKEENKRLREKIDS